MRLHMLAFAATFALAACATQQDDAAATPTMQACNADAAKDAVGKQATDDVVEQARVAAGAAIARALRPDMVITMEYRGDRLNLRTDTDGKVVGVSCG